MKFPIVDLTNDVTEPQNIDVELPSEPPTGSVVLDREGYAWQLRQNASHAAWFRVNASLSLVGRHPHIKAWRYLLIDEGPLTLVYRAPVDTSGGAE